MSDIHILTVKDVAAKIAAGDGAVLLDVREPHEVEICKLPNSILVPLGQLQDADLQWPKNQPIICYCRSGGRSLKAAQILVEKGYENVSNMAGGMLAWADDIDPTTPKY